MRALGIALLLATAASTAAAQPALDSITPYVMARTDVRAMTASSGAEYRIYVWWPQAPPPPEGYPVLYVLDGDESFGIAAEAANRMGLAASRTRIAPGVVVAIGYPGATRRSIDYTPSAPPAPPEPGARIERVGGADAFLDFIVRDLRPAIERDYRIDPTRQSLMGHSYGGLLVLHALFTRPGLFQTWIAASPSIWFAGEHVLAREPAFVAQVRQDRLPRTLVMTVGEYEQAASKAMADDPRQAQIVARNARRAMVDNARDLAGRLEALKDSGLEVHFRVLSGETHGSSPLPAIGAGVHHAFSGKPQ